MKPVFPILFLFINGFCFAQILPSVDSRIPIQADAYCGSDNFGFYYGIQPDNTFFKAKDGKFTEYQNIALGRIKKADLENPLKIVLFYENFNTVVLLDNQLNELQKINFSEIPDAPVVAAVGMAAQNRLWIYDSLSQKLGLWDYLNNTYKFITPAFQGNIRAYGSDFNYFEWIDENHNWYSCDIFGKISILGKVPDFDEAQLTGNPVFIYRKGKNLSVFDSKTVKSYQLENIDAAPKSFFLKDQILAIFTGSEIINYKIILP